MIEDLGCLFLEEIRSSTSFSISLFVKYHCYPKKGLGVGVIYFSDIGVKFSCSANIYCSDSARSFIRLVLILLNLPIM